VTYPEKHPRHCNGLGLTTRSGMSESLTATMIGYVGWPSFGWRLWASVRKRTREPPRRLVGSLQKRLTTGGFSYWSRGVIPLGKPRSSR
jgi:hypothetical protein